MHFPPDSALNTRAPRPKNPPMPPTNADLVVLAKRHLYNNYKPAPIVFARGKGCELFDVDRTRWLQLCAGVAVCSVGHGHPKLARAIADQAARLMHVSN